MPWETLATNFPAASSRPGKPHWRPPSANFLEETGYAGGTWTPWMTLSPNPATCTNLAHSFLATGVQKVSGQHLDPTEDIEVRLESPAFVRDLLMDNQILQALMAAPLWKYFYGKIL